MAGSELITIPYEMGEIAIEAKGGLPFIEGW